MKILLICVAVILGNYTLIFAQKTIISQDSTIDQSDFKHNKQYFLDTYNIDDSTKALINYFFRIRKAAAVETIVGLVLSGSSLIYIVNALSPGSHYSLGASIIALPLIPIAGIFALEVIEGSIIRLVYTKRKLLHLIANYQAGKHLPGRFTHRIGYKREWRIIKGIKPSIWNILFST